MNIVYTELLVLLGMPFILALWIALRNRWRVSAGARTNFHDAHLYDTHRLNLDFESATVGLAAALTAALEEVAALARAHNVGLGLAVDPEIRVHTHTSVLEIVLRDTLVAAISAASVRRVLVTAAILDGQPNIHISDDGTGGDQPLRESLVRDAGALIALRGGSIAVHASPARGTTVVVRLPLPKAETTETGEPWESAVLADRAA